MAGRTFTASEARDIILNDDSDSSGDEHVDNSDDDDYLPEDTASENEDSEATNADGDLSSESSDSGESSAPSNAATVAVTHNAVEMKAKSGKVWSCSAPVIHRRQAQDVIHDRPGAKQGSHKPTVSEVYQLYVTEEIIDVVIRETNREGRRVCSKWNDDHPNKLKAWRAIDDTEFKAYIGLLILAGVYHGNHEGLEELWNPRSGRPVFIATMSLDRFRAITRMLRFDNKTTRDVRLQTDKLAAFRDVWAMFVAQLKKYYNPGPDITVDEQLVPFRGRVSFKQYIPSKPAKYGIKIWWCCDAGTSYPLNADVYLGRQPNEPRQTNQGSSVVRKLVEPWYRSGRNVVGDNFFTSCELGEFLLSQNLTYVGTIRRNKTDIPEEMKASRDRTELSSVFGFSGQQTLVSYVPKKNKAVILLSTLHHDKVVAGDKFKPEIILHYNQTKSGVDNLDHLITNYTCKRKTNRWPMVLFMNMLDVGGIASLVVWLANNPTWNERRRRQRRRLFLVELGEQLVSEQIRRRVQTDWQHCSLAIRTAAASLGFGRNPPQQATTAARPSNGRCHLCPRSADKKSRKRCSECMQCVCTQHSTELLTCNSCQ